MKNIKMILALAAIFSVCISSYGLEEVPSPSYFKEIRITPQYNNYISGEISVGIPDTPLDLSAGGNGGWWLVGHVYNCHFALAKCDQNRVSFKQLN